MFNSCVTCKYFKFTGTRIFCEKQKFTPIGVELIHPNFLVRQCFPSKKYIECVKEVKRWLETTKVKTKFSIKKDEVYVEMS